MVVIDGCHIRLEGVFFVVYFKGCKEWEHDRFYIQ
jgi:hypothetical protein